eukprot:Gregarina_sp_Poly_1__3433@NODE_199_length_11565_cov_209_900244_g178_i0_p1_GENE_NODE_199_length_11565_cov_209_900244_g178_i0NODE_199_length_11565_cov_209_900244_g178_i0_p1_ORF_typecomplete_len707_score74_72ATPgrasp_5/PF13549_6/6_1e03ATPgrasp_5/PF13549_6/1_6e48Succ_CoA_lig/PF13607_6/6_9e03Succ_CoA_lig/PF13607_6/3e33CoA_binding_2/PF13380_6/1_5e19CoA_binding_2/PF13380_6/1_1e04Ligase_CoA/PF00549_19/0_019Ligase_CoA/PF00549_19/8_6Ligase_CoA/PF00549_19/6_8e03ATPgrasp_2/PF08442_10/0_00056ATPgrasp_2/PF084
MSNTYHRESFLALLAPRGVAVVGVTDGDVESAILSNLLPKRGPYDVFPVNPRHAQIFGSRFYRSIAEIQNKDCDLVIIVTAARLCPSVAEDCAKNKTIRAMVVIYTARESTGSEEYRQSEKEFVTIAKRANIRLIGPTRFGIQSPHIHLNATSFPTCGRAGGIALLSQSSAVCTAMIDWAQQVHVGFSAIISLGSMNDLDWADCMEYFAQDNKTTAIVVYMETIGSASRFVKTARRITKFKPVTAIKAGKINASQAAFAAAMRRIGVLSVDNMDELQMLAMLNRRPGMESPKLLIITNAWGPGLLATDAAVNSGLELCELSRELRDQLRGILRETWLKHNPINVLEDATPDKMRRIIEKILRWGPKKTTLLVILAPAVSYSEMAHQIWETWERQHLHGCRFDGPLVTACLGGSAAEEGRRIFNQASTPCFSQADSAATVIGLWWKQTVLSRATAAEQECPLQYTSNLAVRSICQAALSDERVVLSDAESKELLKVYKINAAESIVCNTCSAAVEAAKKTGFPVIVKLNSITIKSDAEGCIHTCAQEKEVEKAWNAIKSRVRSSDFQGVVVRTRLEKKNCVELLLGSSSDKQFGPVLVFGTGGRLAEVIGDVVVEIPPINLDEANRLLQRPKIGGALVNRASNPFRTTFGNALTDTLVKFSHFIYDNYSFLKECEINPLLVTSDAVVALDARVVLHQPNETLVEPCL